MVDTPMPEPEPQTTTQKWGSVAAETYAKIEKAVGVSPRLSLREILSYVLWGALIGYVLGRR